jgi:hypothetical protein
MSDKSNNQIIPPEYRLTLESLILRVKQAQYNALKTFSSEKVMMAWDFGRIISEKVAGAN